MKKTLLLIDCAFFRARLVLLNFREDGVTPYVTVWKHGLTEMKV